MVHLPTYLLLLPEEWQPGQMIRETYDFVLPQTLQVETTLACGHVRRPAWFGIRTDATGLVPAQSR